MKGGCLCGKIRFESEFQPSMTAVCHCPDCQKQTGTSFSIVVAMPLEELRLEGELSIYSTSGDSGAKVHRHFCNSCGSPIYSLPDAMPGMIFLKAGTLDDTGWLAPNFEMFCDTAQPWVALGGDWDRMPRNPPFE